jgi:hypothetical protein
MSIQSPPAFQPPSPFQSGPAFGAVVEKVPSAGAQWAVVERPVPVRRSSTLLTFLLLAALGAGGWYGWAWWQSREELPVPVAQYVDGAGVQYTSPVTGVSARFHGAPTEIELLVAGTPSPAAAHTGGGWTTLAVMVPAPVPSVAVEAAAREHLGAQLAVRARTVVVDGTVFAAVVAGPDAGGADAMLDRFAATVRVPGGATL